MLAKLFCRADAAPSESYKLDATSSGFRIAGSDDDSLDFADLRGSSASPSRAHSFERRPTAFARRVLERAIHPRSDWSGSGEWNDDEAWNERRSQQAADRASLAMDELVGSSAPLQRVHDLLERIRDSDASVLISGESGTGKEIVARILHKTSRRHAGPFVAVNCAAISETLLESELFGHAKGAFTDARARHEGIMQRATGGTLFLDEIGEMPFGLQPKLLRALQEKVVRPVGADREVPFDARIVCATNKNIHTAVLERTFREDLFFRINVVHLELPPLRARGNDVLILAELFLKRITARAGKQVTGFTSSAVRRLCDHSWPGNVRELQNCIECAVALTCNRELDLDDLPERIRGAPRPNQQVVAVDPAELLSLAEVERRHIAKVVDAVGGNKSLAAKVLGIDRKTLYRKLPGSSRP